MKLLWRRWSLVIVVSGALCGLPLEAEAQSADDRPSVDEAIHLIEVWIDAQRAYEQVPGVSAAVVHDQELLWSGSSGHAHRDREEPARPSTIYSICSISKLFTSVAVMQLRDRGMLDLDDPVSRHLPWFDLEQAYPNSPPLTIEALLTHSAGLPRESAHPYWTGPAFEFPSEEAVIRELSSQETLYPARRYFQYSNLGLSLAGYVVEELTGMDYGDYVREQILGPLGLDDTFTEIPAEHRDGRLATGYGAITREGEREATPFFQARGIAPAAGFASTVEDLARFASWQFRLDPGTEEVLEGNTLREMHRVHWVDPDFDTYWGLGFSVSRDDGTTFVGHGGSCPGYRTHLRLQMDDRLATIFAANALGVNPGRFTRAMHDIVSAAVGDADVDPDDPEPAVSGDGGSEDRPAADLERFTGTYRASFGGEIAVLEWKDGLAMLRLPTDDPLERLTELERVEEATFRRVRDDGEPGEEVVFETDDEGEVVRMVRFSNHYPRVRPPRSGGRP